MICTSTRVQHTDGAVQLLSAKAVEIRLEHGGNALYGVSELEFVCRGCETDAGRLSAARRFVQDWQSGM